MSFFKNISCIIAFFFFITINFFCKAKHSVKNKEIVGLPSEMDAKVNENIKDILEYAINNNGRINDSIKLALSAVANAFYKQNDYKNVWSEMEEWNPIADSMYHFIHHAELSGLFPHDYHLKDLDVIKKILEQDSLAKTDAIVWTKADLMLTDAFMLMLQHLKQGRLLPDSISLRADKGVAQNFFIKNLHNALNVKSVSSILNSVEPKHAGYAELKKGMQNFLDSMDRMVYTYVVYPNKDSLALVKNMQKRLYQSGYIDKTNLLPDSSQLAKAIIKFQKEKGIKPDGKISSSVVKRLNENDVEKFKRIAITLDRYKHLPPELPEKYIWVNLPGYYLKVIDNDTVALWSKVIVGKPASHTPSLNSFITDMVTYPQWTIPNSIIKNDILPALKRDPAYLSRKGFSLFDLKDEVIDPYTINWAKYTRGIPYKIRQGSGDDNTLGIYKFNFYNRYNVYLHDTNQRYLFKNSARALSHGCVRVQQWEKLAFFIAKNDSINLKQTDTLRYNTDSIKLWLANKEKRRIIVKNKLPLFIRYFTCEGKDGRIIFYEDIYGEDKLLRNKYFANK